MLYDYIGDFNIPLLLKGGENMVKRIGVLTSGGDAPGMNPAVRAVVRTALDRGIEVFGIEEGYYGLYHEKIKQFTHRDVGNIINRGGTILRSARFPEFAQPETREHAKSILDKYGIEALVVVGGDGSYMGAMRLTEMGVNCVGLPGTIDNDIKGTDFTIGFHTALDTIVDSIDKLRDTSSSHHRCNIVEIMGRNAGDLTLYAGIATGADAILIPEVPMTKEELYEEVRKSYNRGKRYAIVAMAEGVKDQFGSADELAKCVEEATGIETRATVLGHIQRGGVPNAMDRVLASRMGNYAVDLIQQGIGGVSVGIQKNEIVHHDIIKAIETMKHTLDPAIYKAANEID